MTVALFRAAEPLYQQACFDEIAHHLTIVTRHDRDFRFGLGEFAQSLELSKNGHAVFPQEELRHQTGALTKKLRAAGIAVWLAPVLEAEVAREGVAP